jgi:predicted  nucleic acid-binding Zn-ribbon protein
LELKSQDLQNDVEAINQAIQKLEEKFNSKESEIVSNSTSEKLPRELLNKYTQMFKEPRAKLKQSFDLPY